MLYFVQENPSYRGVWWSEGGHRLWYRFAPDEVDTEFYIPAESLWEMLAEAQKIPGWEEDCCPLVWYKAPDPK